MSEYTVAILVFFAFLLALVGLAVLAIKIAWMIFRGVVRGSATLTYSALRGWKPPR